MLDFQWMADHLDDLAVRTLQHIELAAIAVAIGLLISFALAVLAVRRRATYGPILAATDILYTIPSLALFVVFITITGISLLTVEIPLVLYTLVIFVRNIAAGFDSIPREVLEAANGLGYTARQRLWRVEVPLAVPLILAGVRLATVSTIALVTVTSVLGDSFGGLGYFILEGYRRSFPTELYFGAVPSVVLALLADFALAQVQRRLTPWQQTEQRAVPPPFVKSDGWI
ncbi:MAG: osmoprotectant transport system permease protein [Chloroflexota bacterium]|jgi:osmoprotectant transport system permease protein|nr:osmoprotectant transport system permease protein [Chloroflexota bacterium]